MNTDNQEIKQYLNDISANLTQMLVLDWFNADKTQRHCIVKGLKELTDNKIAKDSLRIIGLMSIDEDTAKLVSQAYYNNNSIHANNNR
jgi:hypothetical protein